MVVFEFLGDLLSGRWLVVAVLAYAAYQLYRGKSILGGVVATVGTVATIAMAVVGVVVVAILFGWVDPDVTQFVGDITAVATTVWDWVGDSIIEFIDGVVS